MPGRVLGTCITTSLWPMSLKLIGVLICLNALMAGILLTEKNNTGVQFQHLVLKMMSFNFKNSSWQMDMYCKTCCDCFWNAFPECTAPAKWKPPGVQFYLIVTRMIMKCIHYLDCMSPVKIGIHYVGNDTCTRYCYFNKLIRKHKHDER